MSKLIKTFVSSVLLVTFLFAVCASVLADEQADSVKPDLIKMNFSEGVELRILLDYISDRLGINIVYDISIAGQRVTILSPAEIPSDSLLDFMRGVLKMMGCSLVPGDQEGWMRVLSTKDFTDASGNVEKDLTTLGKSKGVDVLTQIFQLQHADPAAVDRTIKVFLSKPGGNSFSIPEADFLIVTDYASNIRRIAGIIELIDQPAGQVEIFFITIQNAQADDLAEQLNILVKQKIAVQQSQAASRKRASGSAGMGAVAISQTNQIAVVAEPYLRQEVVDLIRVLDVPSNSETRRYYFKYVSPQKIIDPVLMTLPKSFTGKDICRYACDEELGLLMFSGPKKIHEQIESLKAELDIPESSLSRDIRYYKLKNTSAIDVLATISSLDPDAVVGDIEKKETSKGGQAAEKFAGPNEPPAEVGKEAPKPPVYRPSQSESEAKKTFNKSSSGDDDSKTKTIVTADINTNTIIVYATEAVHTMYKGLIVELDKRRPQVMIEVTMVTLDTSRDFSLGVELSHSGTVNGADYLVFSAFGLSTVDSVTGSLALTPGVGFNGAVLNPGSFNAVIQALESDANAKVVSSPRILVNDNATATLSSTAQQPFSSVNASDTVSTTSFGGYAEAGSTLTVTPHIAEGDHLSLAYSIELSSFSDEGSGGIPAPRQQNMLDSEVTVPDGYTVVVGGLKRKDISKTVAKIPFLGDIPLIGKAFSLTDDSNRESTLFVFIRPVILRDDQFEDLKYLSELDLEKAEMDSNYPTSESLILN